MFVPAETEKRPSHCFHWEESAHWLELLQEHTYLQGTWNQTISLGQEDFMEDGDYLFCPSHTMSFLWKELGFVLLSKVDTLVGEGKL